MTNFEIQKIEAELIKLEVMDESNYHSIEGTLRTLAYLSNFINSQQINQSVGGITTYNMGSYPFNNPITILPNGVIKYLSNAQQINQCGTAPLAPLIYPIDVDYPIEDGFFSSILYFITSPFFFIIITINTVFNFVYKNIKSLYYKVIK